MNIILKCLIYFGVSFVFMLLIYLLIINKYIKKLSSGKAQTDINYLINKFKLDMRKTKYSTVRLVISIMNSFIIAFTFTIISNLKIKYFYKLLVAFVILLLLIYSLYEIAGRILKKREDKK